MLAFILAHFSSLIYTYREVSTEEGEKKAIELGVMFIEVSAKSGYNIKTVSVATSVGWPIVFSAVLHYSPGSVL